MRKLTEEWQTERLELFVEIDHLLVCISDGPLEHVGHLHTKHPVLILGDEQMLQIFQARHLQMLPGYDDVLLQLSDFWKRYGCFELLDLRIRTLYVPVELFYELFAQSKYTLLILFELVQISREIH